MEKYECNICKRELDLTLTQISVCIDGELESFCMGCEGKINEYVEKSGKTITPILSEDDWNELLKRHQSK